MPDLNDFYAYKITTSGSNNSSSGRNSSIDGCGSPIIWIAAIISVLWIIGKLST